MRPSILFFTALASCILPALAQNGKDCGVVKTVTVKSGDSLASIAKTEQVSLDQVIFVNPQISNPRFIKAGDMIKIPNAKCVAPVKTFSDPTATCSNGTASNYTIVAGDTLTIIAKEKFNITLAALEGANPQIKNPNAIGVGQVINIPLCGSGGASTGAGGGSTGATSSGATGPRPTGSGATGASGASGASGATGATGASGATRAGGSGTAGGAGVNIGAGGSGTGAGGAGVGIGGGVGVGGGGTGVGVGAGAGNGKANGNGNEKGKGPEKPAKTPMPTMTKKAKEPMATNPPN